MVSAALRSPQDLVAFTSRQWEALVHAARRANLLASIAERLAELGLLPVTKGGSLQVLIVDDDPGAVELIALHLDGLASKVLRAYGGADAIEMARREMPDLIVLDLLMPEVNGFDVVAALHENDGTATIPILIVTSKSITPRDRDELNGFVSTIMEKADFDGDRFALEVRRAMTNREAVV